MSLTPRYSIVDSVKNITIERLDCFQLPQKLTLEDGFQYYWKVDHLLERVDVEMHVLLNSSSSSEWFAVGFSNYGDLYPSDLCFYWEDYWGHSKLQVG